MTSSCPSQVSLGFTTVSILSKSKLWLITHPICFLCCYLQGLLYSYCEWVSKWAFKTIFRFIVVTLLPTIIIGSGVIKVEFCLLFDVLDLIRIPEIVVKIITVICFTVTFTCNTTNKFTNVNLFSLFPAGVHTKKLKQLLLKQRNSVTKFVHYEEPINERRPFKNISRQCPQLWKMMKCCPKP